MKLPSVDKTTAYKSRMGPKSCLSNSIRDKNMKRMGSDRSKVMSQRARGM